jgi:hypothetical protein
LTTREARGIADEFLIAKFKKIGAADGDQGRDDLARDPTHGHARQMLCEALRRWGDERAVALLIDLLDEEWPGHVAQAIEPWEISERPTHERPLHASSTVPTPCCGTRRSAP